MRTRLLILILCCSCICSEGALAQLQKQVKPKTPATIQKPSTPSKVESFIAVLQKAKSLTEAREAFEKSAFSQAEIEQVKNRIEGTPALKAKLDDLQNKMKTAAQTERQQVSRMHTAQVATLQTELNTQRVATYRQEVLSVRQDPVANPLDPAVRCMADAPTITRVTPVTPGVEFAIRGKGFGEHVGTVELATAGKVFVAHVTGWNSCTIYAMLGDHVSGVLKNPQAALSVTTKEGKKTRATADFSPAIETREGSEHDYVFGYYWGGSKDWTYWDFRLKNDWYVVSTSLRHFKDGHAEITSAPARNVPNGSARTRVHAGTAALGLSSFTVTLTLAGPKGLPHR